MQKSSMLLCMRADSAWTSEMKSSGINNLTFWQSFSEKRKSIIFMDLSGMGTLVERYLSTVALLIPSRSASHWRFLPFFFNQFFISVLVYMV